MFKKIVAATALGIALTVGCLGVPSVAEAAPFIELGANYNGPEFYTVDKGTLMASGKINRTILRVTVISDFEGVKKNHAYRFTKADGKWMFVCDTDKKSKGKWIAVKGNRLANDILYVITTH